MKALLRKLDKPLLFFSLGMFIFGLVMIFSASYVRAFVVAYNAYQYLIRQGLILIVCIFVFLVVISIPISFYKKLIYPILYGTIASLIAIFFFGTVINGAQRWFNLGFFNFQPSEIAKTVIIVFMGVHYHKIRNNKDNYVLALVPIIYVAIISFLIFAQPDLGTTLIIFGITALTFIAIPMNKKIKKRINLVVFSGLMVLCIAMGFAVLNGKQILTTTQIQRFNFLKPCTRYMEAGTGYQVCNGYIAINNGGLFGVGIGNSTQKFLYLPEAHTDFIFPVIVEELGLIIGILVILIYAFIIYRVLYISRKSSTLMGSIICYGIAMYIFMHVFVNLVGILGILPLTGVPLPFLSYGGSFAINITICLGLVQRVCIDTNRHTREMTLRNKIKGR